MLSKCSAFGKKDDVAQIEKITAYLDNSGFRKSSPTVYLFSRFWYYSIKILPTISLVLGKNKGKLQSCSLDLPYQEKLKHQWQLFMIPKRLPSRILRLRTPRYKMQTCHKFQFAHFNLRSTANFHFAWWSNLERKKIEWEMGKDTRNMEVSKRANTWITHNARGGAKLKSIEFSLPQAQVFYISSRKKIQPCKNNKSFTFSFYAQLYSNF